ncbi:hypothetical protein AGDE_03962 [Angomonas deanei]|uniref:Uncharacterized protein n=1 Tax=Angomonas deanei TaxID=59799 RepID=A0A7G2CAY4_9TRYP|nr:hypothetical protein AGDE_03962 [Angomonas deanei]CAD2216956.1 hypothetical protein, conserved [Angomonas deanei]|eukprot:EPY39966.1 hypothetical protein AGDE_03962 [Angomonas deanei]
MREEAYYSSPNKHTVPQPPGQDSNLYLKSYYYTPVETTVKPHPNDLSQSANPQATSVQLAEARLRQIERENPRYRPVAEKAMATCAGDFDIVEKENAISRQIQREQYAKDSRKRVEEITKNTKYHGTPDLGSPTPSVEKNIPYALNFSGPRPDSANLEKSGVRITHNHNAESRPAPQRVRPVDRRQYNKPKPYDTVNVSGDAYPSPPPVGVSQSIWQKPSLVHHSSRNYRTCTEDKDTLDLKRARARQSQSRDRTDFIFGPAPVGNSPQPRSLRVQTEKRMKQQENQNFERRTGKAHVGPAYKDTSLW